jgi:hypothetical protein
MSSLGQWETQAPTHFGIPQSENGVFRSARPNAQQAGESSISARLAIFDARTPTSAQSALQRGNSRA